MSVWRRKAIEYFPKSKKEFEQPNTNIYTVFFELLPETCKAHRENEVDQLTRIYDFAEWCFRQKEKNLWNAAGVAFYEHLGDFEETFLAMPTWVKPDIYNDIRPLLAMRLDNGKMKKLDISYYALNK